MINYRLKIDFSDSKTLASDICFVSGDVKSSTLYFEFYNEGKRVDISGYTLSIRAKRSDGVVVASSGKIKENTAVFTPESNMYCVPGELYMEIALTDATGKYATTKIITAEVVEGLGETAIEGVDNLNIYVKLVADAISAKEEAKAFAEIAKSVHPQIRDGIWWVYDATKGVLVSSGIKAEGTQGIKGEKGDQGIPGYTPQREVDYWTLEDKNSINKYVDDVFEEISDTLNTKLDETSEHLGEEVENLQNDTKQAMFDIKTQCSNVLKGYASCKINGLADVISIEDISPIEHNLWVKVSSKNLIVYPYQNTTSTISGVTFTDNGDGTITVNGTNNSGKTIYFQPHVSGMWNKSIPIEAGTYTFSGCPEGGSTTTYSIAIGIRAVENGTRNVIVDNGKGKTFTTEGGRFDCIINIYDGATLENVVFKPQLELGTTATFYTPYVPDVSKVVLSTIANNYAVSADGTVEGVKSIYPNMTLFTDMYGVLVECEYNKDINKAFAELQNAIISLGGNV